MSRLMPRAFRGTLTNAAALIRGYLHARYLLHLQRNRAILAGLPARTRFIAWAMLGLATLLIVAIPFVYLLHGRLAAVPVPVEDGKAAALPVLSLYLSLLGIALGWAAVLAGASLIDPLLLAALSLFYLFTFTFLGLTGGRGPQAPWLIVPGWLSPVLLAVAPAPVRGRAVRLGLLWVLCALAVFHTFRLTALAGLFGPMGHTGRLLVAAAAGIPPALVLHRIRRRAEAAPVFLAAVLVNLGFLAAVLVERGASVAASAYESLTQLVILLAVFWFLLGAELVEFAFESTRSALTALASFTSERFIPALAVALWIAELLTAGLTDQRGSALIWRFHRPVALVLLAVAVLLVPRRAFTAALARRLLAVWVFSYVLLWAYARDIAALAGEEALTFATAALFIFGTAFWEIVKGMHRLSPDGVRRTPAQGLLLCYLGGLLALVAATHFSFAAGIGDLVRQAHLSQVLGVAQLWAPAAIFTLVYEQRAVPPPPGRLVLRAFLTGAALSPLAYALKAALAGTPEGAGIPANLAVMAAAAGLQIWVVRRLARRSPDAARPLDAAAAGLACAFGFAAGYASGLVAQLLVTWVNVALLLLGYPPSAGAPLFAWDAQVFRSMPAADRWYLYVVAPLVVTLAALMYARTRPGAGATRAGSGDARTSLWAGMILGASLLYAIPLYANPLSASPISVYGALIEGTAWLYGTLAYLAVPLGVLAVVLYLTAWRPAQDVLATP